MYARLDEAGCDCRNQGNKMTTSSGIFGSSALPAVATQAIDHPLIGFSICQSPVCDGGSFDWSMSFVALLIHD